MATANTVLWEEVVPGGNHWSGILRRGTQLRFTDMKGGANVSLSLYNRETTLERLNIPDTLKGQHTAFLTTGRVCYSDMGRVLCSFVEDSVGWHDALCGPSDAHDIAARYGERSYATARNEMFRNGRDGLLIELGKWGLGKRDLGATVNLFSKVTVNDEGSLVFQPDNSQAGSFVTLRFEMDVLLALSTAPHRLDPESEYAPAAVQLLLERADEVAPDDVCRLNCPQNERAFINTERLYAR
ncbi:hypothetical protein IAD21_01594 [Abditibacteriota bacterium]|nr:hypothetical protein IAD21_01594 [Abditibacteriota bacterium]